MYEISIGHLFLKNTQHLFASVKGNGRKISVTSINKSKYALTLKKRTKFKETNKDISC